jgi:hypothetical protein
MDQFLGNVVHRGDVSETVAQLQRFQPDRIVAACESGVEVADALAEAMGLDGNGTALSRARRDKHAQVAAVAAAGLAAPAQGLFTSASEVLEWRGARRLADVVVKRPNSSGSNDVYVCSADGEIRAACERILSRPTNKLGFQDTAVLVQTYLLGDEYVVDTVSSADLTRLVPDRPAHRVVAIWRYRKVLVAGTPLYQAMEILPSRGPIQDALSAYAVSVLDRALGVRWGACHFEIIWNVPPLGGCLVCGSPLNRRAQRFCAGRCFDVAHGLAEGSVRLAGEPVLVEVGARPHGGHGARVGELALPGGGQINLLADALVSPRQLTQRTRLPYRIDRHAWQVFLTCDRDGTLKGVHHLDDVRRLPSFHEMVLKVGVGQGVERTHDHWSIPGMVILAHPDRAVVEADYSAIRRWNRDGMFEVH